MKWFFLSTVDLKNYIFIDFIPTVLTKIHLKLLSFEVTLVKNSEFCSPLAHPLPLYTLQSKTCMREASFPATKVSTEVRTVKHGEHEWWRLIILFEYLRRLLLFLMIISIRFPTLSMVLSIISTGISKSILITRYFPYVLLGFWR